MKTQFHAEAARDNKENLDCGRGRGECSYWKDEEGGFAQGSRMADVRGVRAGQASQRYSSAAY